MREIKSILHMAEQGCSHPFLCIGEDESRWWCKGQLSGTESQRREWICANLARQLNLPVPDFEIMEVPEGLFELWQLGHPECRDVFVMPSNPYVFASRLVPDCRDLSVNSLFLARGDRQLQARVFAFDRAIRNTDRTDWNSNILVDVVSESTIRLIDHNNAFDPDFDEVEFREGHIFRGAYLPLSAQERAGLDAEVRRAVAAFDLQAVWDAMPEAWTEEITTGLTADGIRGILSDSGSTPS